MILNPFDDHPHRLRTKVGVIFALLIMANLLAWAWALAMFADRPTLIGTALLAYMFGLRHAFDADHIAAIDNVVRRLTQERRKPIAAGFFFSLGHSTVVILACVAIAAMATALRHRFADLHAIGGIVGAGVSATFLLLIALGNLVGLGGLRRAFLKARRGEHPTDETLAAPLPGGVLGRLFRPFFRLVSRSWLMYPVGFLFGLGFDTASEVGLLGISALQAGHGESAWTILVFPALFTVGMSLVDTADSALMTGAYGWALINPVRKLWYNMTITVASIVVALFVGGVEGLALIGDRLSLPGAFWRAISALNGNLMNFGCVVVMIFVGSWVVSAGLYRIGGQNRLAGRPSASAADECPL